ncbi:hypothetical protein [Neptuniibacter sp. QD34_54]|uniref:hypothetical protein n=1 Tax=Neptuniibacter sp. QD34_54 TaxID=3398208 RepID=UPI0039F636E7
MKKLVILSLMFVLAGCQVFTRLPETQSTVQNKGKDFEVTIPGGWVEYNDSKENTIVLTKEGPALQWVNFRESSLDKPFEFIDVKLKSDALVNEVADHFVENLKAQQSGLTVEKNQLVPMDINGNDGFKLTLNATNPNGLVFKVLVYGSITTKSLYILSYESPALYFFEKELPEFESMANSFQILSQK